MKNIKIFVAGSKSLVRERESLKSLISDLNSHRKDDDYVVTVFTFEHFDDNQDEYNRFIRHEADIVIFILDGQMADKTENEFILATDSFNLNGRPEIFVFLKNASAGTEEIGKIKGLLAGRLGGSKYYVDYSDVNDLGEKVRQRVSRYLDKLGKSDGASQPVAVETTVEKPAPPVTAGPRRRLSTKVVISILTGIIVILAGVICRQAFRQSIPLILAGGGSVNNYILDSRGVDILEYPNSIYCNMASGTAWALLAEEATRMQEDKSRRLERFSTICLSADDIDSSSYINEKTKGIFNHTKIIRYNVGYDSLVVYVHDDIFKKRPNGGDTERITVDSLRALVKYALSAPGDIRIFSTSKESGTLRLYQSCFEPADSVDLNGLLDNEHSYIYHKDSELTYITSLNSDTPGRS